MNLNTANRIEYCTVSEFDYETVIYHIRIANLSIATLNSVLTLASEVFDLQTKKPKR